MSFLARIFAGRSQRQTMAPLYRALSAAARDPFWYLQGQVPDTVDGRFDVLAALTALVLLRLEREGEAGRGPSVLLTEVFVDDMDASLRQMGIGDYVVGKHIGRLMGALGGRLGAFRGARGDETDWEAAVRRNLFHEAPPGDEPVRLVAARLAAFDAALDGLALEPLIAGEVQLP